MNILAIGAFERDNFGDLLFLEVFRGLVGDRANVYAGSIIYSDMREINGEIVYPYHYLLNNFKFDYIYVVGGEVGAVNIKDGLMMDFSYSELNSLKNISNKESDLLVKSLTGIDNYGINHAYIPDLRKYPKNKKAKLILNSVGLSKISILNDDFLENTLEILNNCHKISVRERDSFNFLQSKGIRALLCPDIVHSIPIIYKKKRSKERYIVFQINEDIINVNNYSCKYIAEKLDEIASAAKMDIKLFLAGTVAFHDNIETYFKIKDEFNKLDSKFKLEIIETRNPVELVGYISAAKLWIGTSLHGRILSCAYNVPRISLENEKVKRYADSWDVDYPSNIKLEKVSCDIEKILRLKSVSGEKNLDLALNNFNQLFNFNNVLKSEKYPMENVFMDISNDMSQSIKDVFIKYLSANEENMELSTKALELEKKVDFLKSENSLLKNSRIYRIGQKYSKILNKIGGDYHDK